MCTLHMGTINSLSLKVRANYIDPSYDSFIAPEQITNKVKIKFNLFFLKKMLFLLLYITRMFQIGGLPQVLK